MKSPTIEINVAENMELKSCFRRYLETCQIPNVRLYTLKLTDCYIFLLSNSTYNIVELKNLAPTKQIRRKNGEEQGPMAGFPSSSRVRK